MIKKAIPIGRKGLFLDETQIRVFRIRMFMRILKIKIILRCHSKPAIAQFAIKII